MFPSTKAKCLWSRTRWDHAAAWAERNPAPGQGQPTKPDQTEFVVCESTIFRRFRRWAQTNVLEHVFLALSGDPDFEYALIDGTIIRVHQHGTGAKGGLVVRRSGAPAAA
jgi:hypothetical protein